MNEQEFKKYVKDTIHSIFTKANNNEKEFINFLVNSFNNICEENKQLHNKIDKSIEYINIVGIKTDKPKYFQMIKDTIWGEELLEILKGSDVNENNKQ